MSHCMLSHTVFGNNKYLKANCCSNIHGLVASFLLLVCPFLLLAGCSDNRGAGEGKKRAVPVLVAPVVQEPTSLVITAVGNVQPQATVAIKTQVGGTITEQFVQDGQSVQQGDLLFRLDPRPFELAIRESQARLERNRILYAKATKDLARYSRLNEINAVAQEQYDKTFADAKSLESDIQLNTAALERAQLDLTYTYINAPISGNVGMVEINKGNVVKANDDRTLCVINQLEPISVSFALPEKYLGAIMEMQQAGDIAVQIFPSAEDTSVQPLAGVVSAMDNSVDITTGTIKLRARYDNTDHRLWPGQFVRVGLVLREMPDALLVPTGAIMDGISGSYVYVVTPDNVAEVRQVKVDFLSGDNSVIASGLAAGERVVLDGQVRLTEGVSVEVRSSSPAAPAVSGSVLDKPVDAAKAE